MYEFLDSCYALAMLAALNTLVTPDLAHLQALFAAEGERLCFVGGCVRDAILGSTPKDIDLCTSADPQRQMEIYTKHDIRNIPTGIDHGTITVRIDTATYEITSFREDVATDGRHATVRYTRDLDIDLGRRDLTFNAMALDFDGTIHDPFGGREDLENGRVRFVGDAAARINEDHLRILRFLRFHFRYAHGNPLDEAAADAIRVYGRKLDDIKTERIWSEVSRIVAGPGGAEALREMMRLDIAIPSKLPHGAWREVKRVHVHTRNPVTLMVAFLGDRRRVATLAADWRWSSQERDLGLWLAEELPYDDLDYRRLVARHGRAASNVAELSYLHDRAHEGRALERWVIPEFPIRGRDLLEAGIDPGPEVGQTARYLKDTWADSGYAMTRDDLLGMIKP